MKEGKGKMIHLEGHEGQFKTAETEQVKGKLETNSKNS